MAKGGSPGLLLKIYWMFISILCCDLTLYREKRFILIPLSTWVVAAIMFGCCTFPLLISDSDTSFAVLSTASWLISLLEMMSVCQVLRNHRQQQGITGGAAFTALIMHLFSRYGSEHPQPTKRVAGHLPQHHPLCAASGWLSIPEGSVKANSQRQSKEIPH